MTLLREIQVAATDDHVSISTVLRKAKTLAARLHNQDFEDWVNHELNGYESKVELPPYRIIRIGAQAHITDGRRYWKAAPVMAGLLPEKLRWWAEEWHLWEPIAAIASMAKEEHGMQVPWPQEIDRGQLNFRMEKYLTRIQEMAVKYGAKGYNNFECLSAWQVLTSSAFRGFGRCGQKR